MARESLGLLQLRRGEQDNCLMHHNREMCLFPLSAVDGCGARSPSCTDTRPVTSAAQSPRIRA